MDDTQIHITVNKGFVERLVYWIIILVLAGLLLWTWMKDDTQESTSTQITDTQTETTPAQEENTPAAVAAATCSDGIKNQNESGVDCGGSCTDCATGIACNRDADCISNICHNNTCVTERPVVLAAKLELDVTNVVKSSAPSGAQKVNGVTYKISNGLTEEFEGFIAKVFIKNKAGTRCLNQQVAGLCDDSYAEFTIPAVAPGKVLTETHTIADDEYTTKVGRYLIDDSGANPQQYSVIMYLYDRNGNEIGGKTLSDIYTVG